MARIHNSPPRSASPAYLILIIASTAALGFFIAGCGARAPGKGGGGNGFNEYPSCNDICDPSCSGYSPSACGVVVGGGTGTGTGPSTGTTGVGSCSDACDASCGGYDAGACDGGGIGDGGCDIDTCGGGGDGGTTIGDPGDGGGDPGIGDGGDDGGGDYGGGDPGDYGGGDPGYGGGDPGDGGGDDWDGGVAHPVNGAHPAIAHIARRAAGSLQLRDNFLGFSPRDLAKAQRARSAANSQKPESQKEEQ